MTTPPHPASHARFLATLSIATELLDRIATVTPNSWGHIVDAIGGQPGAQALDRQGGPGSVVVCTRHERDIADCQRTGEVGCTGSPIPRRTDPTGAAGTVRDHASMDIRTLHRKAEAVLRAAEDIERIMAGYVARPPTEAERRATAAENDGSACESCARIDSPHHDGVPAYSPAERRVQIGTLGTPVALCNWCRTWHRQHGALPDRTTLEAHHRGDRIRHSA